MSWENYSKEDLEGVKEHLASVKIYRGNSARGMVGTLSNAPERGSLGESPEADHMPAPGIHVVRGNCLTGKG